jgi:hypothetical protein
MAALLSMSVFFSAGIGLATNDNTIYVAKYKIYSYSSIGTVTIMQDYKAKKDVDPAASKPGKTAYKLKNTKDSVTLVGDSYVSIKTILPLAYIPMKKTDKNYAKYNGVVYTDNKNFTTKYAGWLGWPGVGGAVEKTGANFMPIAVDINVNNMTVK